MAAPARHRWWIAGALSLCASLGAVAPFACNGPAPYAKAESIVSRNQLIGGDDALGDIGDFKLSNGKVRFIIQGTNGKSGYSRGWGVYGGSLLDADLQRPASSFTGQPKGNDHFGEMFPAYFLEALDPTSVSIGNDGSDGKPASIVVKGSGQPFLTLARFLLNTSGIDFSTAGVPGLTLTNTYSLGPQDQFLTVTTTIAGAPGNATPLDIRSVHVPLGAGADISIPMGWVVLLGAQNNEFVQGAGFDLYYSLQDAFAHPATLPAFGGLLTDLIATSAPGVSYGVAVAPPPPDALDTSYVYANQHNFAFPPASPPEQQMLIPFVATSFTGVFAGQAPASIPVGSSYSYKSYFIVGQGDVGSVRDVYYGIRGTATGTITAKILEQTTHLPITKASLIVLKDGQAFLQYQVDANGVAIGHLAPGNYTAEAVCDNRERFPPIPFSVRAGETTQIAGGDPTMPYALAMPRNALLNVLVHEGGGANDGRPLPAKVTLVGTSPSNPAWDGLPPRKYLYDLTVGDRMLPTVQKTYDHNDPTTWQYIERILLSDTTGLATGQVHPGTYEVIVSRGPEYDAADLGKVTFARGQVVSLGAVLHHVVDTTGWISADFHMHSDNSIDGEIDLNTRLIACAAEGLESVTSTDHNIVTDYTANLSATNLRNYVRTEVGLELTTIEMGHFNAFPLTPQPDSITWGSFLWNNMPPTQLFDTLRAPPLAQPGRTVLEMNHARDGTLGYFNQFNVDQDEGVPVPANMFLSPNSPAFQTPTNGSTISWDFDAMEVYNSKRRELVRTMRMPTPVPPITYCTPPMDATYAANSPGCVNIPSDWPAGAIIRTPCATGTVCTDDLYATQPIAYPGEVEDWFNILNESGRDATSLEPQGTSNPAIASQIIHPVTATGNSDSHSLYFAEPGDPRNFLYVGHDDPRLVSDADISQAVFQHKVVVSNGPFVTISAQAPSGGPTAQIGDLLQDSAGSVNVHIKVQAAPWMSVDRVTVYTNITGAVQSDRQPDATPMVIPLTNVPGQVVRYDQVVSVPLPGGKDAWIVVLAEGFENMFPIISGLEQPPLYISDALAAIEGPLGLTGPNMGPLVLPRTSTQVPWAITNPIWIDGDGDHVSFGRTPTGAVGTQN
jgi:hypothetical protein